MGSKGASPPEGAAAEARASGRDPGKVLKDKEGLNRLRRERKANQRGAQCQMGNFAR